ncbi:hypothetical protein [Burkholderia sp. TSV86]|uniref:hypothetical protein n=1 Tax=Burkholderia sp. TSV86 TaxID=1385594 RepID=UPI000A6D095F|nr:hypothetical protein [Burkholderia sp. TSV86]
MSIPRYLPPDVVELLSVVHVVAWRGDGSSRSPERLAHLYYAPDGELLACHDPLNGAPDEFWPLALVEQKEVA